MRVRLLALLLAITRLCSAQTTEVPHTVAPGRFLLEVDALSLTFDREGDDKRSAIAAATTFISTGLTRNWDVQIGMELFLSQRVTTAGLGERTSGRGDLFLRTK